MRGTAVLKDRIDGKNSKPEDYVPRQLFHMQREDASNPFQFKKTLLEKYWSKASVTKITAVRNPFDRLYSGWKDKSRTFRLENGKVDWEKAIAETTWAWGTENMNKKEQSGILKAALKSHDTEFDPKRFGIDRFEERDLI